MRVDGARPVCERCQKGNFVCDGYDLKVLWIDQREAASRRSSLKNTPSPRRGSATAELGTVIKKSPSPFSIDAYIAFTVKKLFANGADSPEPKNECWISSIIQDDSSHVSYTALKCLATAYFGRMQKRSDIMLQGAHLYSKALLQLKASIENPITAHDHRNVAATMALVHYETIAYTGKYGWIQHAGGTGRLMEMRGPERHQDEPAHTYFILSRFQITIQACMSRKLVCFDRLEWQTVPWAKHPDTKTPTDRLVDILTHLPSIFQEYDRLNELAGDLLKGKDGLPFHLSGRAEAPDQEAWEAMRCKLIVLLERLEQWRQEWMAKRRAAALEKPPEPLTSLTWDPSLAFPAVVLHYSDFDMAHETALYTIAQGLMGSLGVRLRDPIGICVQVLATDRRNLPSMLTPRSLARAASEPGNEGQSHQLSQLLPIGTPGEDVAQLAVRTMDYLLLEPYRGKSAFTVMVLMRLW